MSIQSTHTLWYLQKSPVLSRFHTDLRLRTSVSRRLLLEFACLCNDFQRGKGNLGEMYDAICNNDMDTARQCLAKDWEKLNTAGSENPDEMWVWDSWHPMLTNWGYLLNEESDWDRFIESIVEMASLDLTRYSDQVGTRQNGPNNDEARAIRLCQQEGILKILAEKYQVDI